MSGMDNKKRKRDESDKGYEEKPAAKRARVDVYVFFTDSGSPWARAWDWTSATFGSKINYAFHQADEESDYDALLDWIEGELATEKLPPHLRVLLETIPEGGKARGSVEELNTFSFNEGPFNQIRFVALST